MTYPFRNLIFEGGGVKTTPFNLSDDRKTALIQSGHDAAVTYLDRWNNTEKDRAVALPSSTE